VGSQEPTLIMLSIHSLALGYSDKNRTVDVLGNINVDVSDGKFVAILGKSGCGKSTLLRCIAGLLKPSVGHVTIDGTEVTGPDLRVGMVFQDSCLFPWLTIEKNIAIGPRFKHLSAAACKTIVDEHLEVTGLHDVRRSLPQALSGGMKQRASIARTLANDPQVILMDEPFGALDSFTRASMQEFLLSLWERGKKTIVFVTHDIEEALYLADEIVILGGSPAEVLEKIQVPFARPRGQGVKRTEEFFRLRNEVVKRVG
jgi:ABC-type nitrate/sulfonate/bicarbonate transport system ATPase subunit